ncbi:MAG: PAS domain S-box protein, partial [Deltaproteobacteria bacterium]|nr:PAS domain S-box protein [Deltaproteobacteria bacterium]
MAINRVLLEALSCKDDVEVAQTCLAVAEELTSSAFGFIGELNQDGRMDVIAISDPGWDACRIPESDQVILLKNMVLRGIWSRVFKDGAPVLSNDPHSHHDWYGQPEGHPETRSFLGVPLKRYGETVGMIGLANRKGGYGDSDLAALQSLSVAFVEALFNKRSELELIRHQTELEALVDERTVELRESEERYRRLAENARDIIWRTDLEGNIQYVNRAVESMLGIKPEKALDIPLSQYMTENSIRLSNDWLRDALKKGKEGFQGEVEYLHRDGHVVPGEFNVSILRDEAGKAVELEGVSRDITARKRAEKKLREVLEDLERSNKDLEMFAYVASHDLQEPLRMISGYRRYKGRLDQDADEFIDFASDGALRMQKLINDLLSYSRVGTHGSPFEPTDCNTVLNDVLAGLQIELTDRNGTVTHDPLPVVTADPTQLASLFQNLITNALKFSGDRPPRVHVSVTEHENEWVFSVKDNGIGIEKRFQDRVFEVFQRLHGREYPGTGIGLAVCKKIAERHGGDISLESEPGRG